jgi:hypothetical protein
MRPLRAFTSSIIAASVVDLPGSGLARHQDQAVVVGQRLRTAFMLSCRA